MSDPKPNRKKNLRLLCVLAIVLMLAGFVTHAAIEVIRNHDTEDFGYFYSAAHAMLKGQDIYAAAGGRYIYPPFIAFVFQPLALLPEIAAAIFWAVISASFLFLALLIAARETAARWAPERDGEGSSLPWLIAAIALLLLADKIHAMFTLGQTDSVMLLGFVCALNWGERRPLSAGIAVGATANIKYLSLICVPYFILKRNYRAAVSSLAAFLFFMVLPAIEIGFAKLVQYLATAFSGLGGMLGFPVATYGARVFKVGWEKSLSFTSAAFRLARSHGAPDIVALIMLIVLFLLIVGGVLILCRAQGVRIFQFGRVIQRLATLEWAVLIFLALAFSPQATSRHMILLVFVFIVALGVFVSLRGRGPKRVLVGAIAVMVAGLSLPFDSLGIKHFLTQWRIIGGPSWCALVLVLALVWSGSRAMKELDLPNE